MIKLDFLKLNDELNDDDIIYFGERIDYKNYKVIENGDTRDFLKYEWLEDHEMDEDDEIAQYLDYDAIIDDMESTMIILELDDYENEDELI